MDDFFINGEGNKARIVRMQTHSEAISTASKIVSDMANRIVQEMKKITGADKDGPIPEPHDLEPDVAKQVMLMMFGQIFATKSGMGQANLDTTSDYFKMVEQLYPELTDQHYKVNISFGDTITDDIVIKVEGITQMPTKADIH